MSAAMRERRGVLMTATARKRGSWKDLVKDDDVEVADSDDEGDDRKASQNEWAELEREVRSELRMKEFASGMGRGEAVNYDDVAGEEAEIDGPPSAPSSPEGEEAEEDGVPKGPPDSDAVVPEGVRTAGDHAKEKKRGGERKTGAARRKKKGGGELGEDGPPHKKKKAEEDPDRWLKMRLEGEDKPKRIDATRIVHYHDYDVAAALASASSSSNLLGSTEKSSESTGKATGSSYRAGLRRDLFDSDDDDDA
mmetsp:Transcript_66638/g.104826  ORF Transcript_66638/g.104826 Transcript_66638/m.104826 type:complete len:251 (+) Transcript_66638:172-924(+)